MIEKNSTSASTNVKKTLPSFVRCCNLSLMMKIDMLSSVIYLLFQETERSTFRDMENMTLTRFGEMIFYHAVFIYAIGECSTVHKVGKTIIRSKH